MFGYNSMSYDKLMVAAFLMYATNCNSTKELITKLYEASKKIIELQDNSDLSRRDYFLNSLREYARPYEDIDVMRVFALNKCGKGIDKNGNTVYFPKGLKQTSINLQWYELLEYELPLISDIDNHFYHRLPQYKGMNNEHLNKIIDKWDRYIIDEWIADMMHYNFNDVFILCELIRLNIDEIKTRYAISKTYKVDVLNSSRSSIANILFEKFYSEFSGLNPKQWKGKKTERTRMAFKRVIFPWIQFKTEPLKELLAEMKQVIVTSLGKSGLYDATEKLPHLKYIKRICTGKERTAWFEIQINNLIYTIATGGLHSQDLPRELKSKLSLYGGVSLADTTVFDRTSDITVWDALNDGYIYVHYDIASFYPSLMVEHEVAPAHMNKGCFVNLVRWLRDTRVSAKHSKEEYIDGIPKDILALVLKIVINSIYGKMGDQYSDLYDRLAVLSVTINGQLMVMMLCEELELNGIEVISANTDGIVVKLTADKKPVFDKITEDWCRLTKFSADSEEYKAYVNRDINNYCIEELNGKRTYKGALNPYMYLVDLQKGYDMPIVAQAVVNYFLDDKPIMETLYEATNILDFCKTQNIGRQFHVEVAHVKDDKICIEEYQRYVRYYVAHNGNDVFKVHNINNTKSSLCSGFKVKIINSLDDERIELRNINYTYYYKECMKIIDPIKLNINPKGKGKAIIKKNSGNYLTLFDDNDL
ncbi:MAG: DNA polymerase [crAssphage sp. isolate ctbg_1]|uniref:Uncharacterized protein n=1 Tax=crAssphage sp. isolate ctbg_1 TaxID=2989854 RepID=A0A345MT52_9CAUD|nr:MAG: DNA polymerase [crAssphage sp. isolate ctbg_1]AXH74552.1 MAG: hypothetical protein [crAssphage sp. isolate ctbg_1]